MGMTVSDTWYNSDHTAAVCGIATIKLFLGTSFVNGSAVLHFLCL
jgi:hypothetical protein